MTLTKPEPIWHNGRADPGLLDATKATPITGVPTKRAADRA
jgi:hypothetical protein